MATSFLQLINFSVVSILTAEHIIRTISVIIVRRLANIHVRNASDSVVCLRGDTIYSISSIKYNCNAMQL